MKKKEVDKQKEKRVGIDETLPHQAGSPVFKGSGISMQAPFTNQYGVVIGDSHYDSPHSPLNTWSKETDPEIMAGEEWVHPTNDIGWNSAENRALIERKRAGKDPFMNPSIDVSYERD